MWSSVDLPAPEAPTRPTSSPRASWRSMPWRTPRLRSPIAKDFFTPREARSGVAPEFAAALISLVPQRVERMQAPRLPRGQGREEQHAHEGAEDDRGDRDRIDDGRDVIEEVDLAVEDLDVEGRREPALDRIDLQGSPRPEQRARARPEDPVPDRDHQEQRADSRRRRAERGEDPDVAPLLGDHHREDREDREAGDDDDEREHDRHEHALVLDRAEEGLAELLPGPDLVHGHRRETAVDEAGFVEAVREVVARGRAVAGVVLQLDEHLAVAARGIYSIAHP